MSLDPLKGDESPDQTPPPAQPGEIVNFMADETIDLRPPLPPLEELMKDGGRLLIVHALKELPYQEYLQTNHWQAVRKAALKAAGYRCQLCLKQIPLDVHHVDETYASRGEEQPADVIALCSGPDGCHKNQHDILRHVISERMRQQFRPSSFDA